MDDLILASIVCFFDPSLQRFQFYFLRTLFNFEFQGFTAMLFRACLIVLPMLVAFAGCSSEPDVPSGTLTLKLSFDGQPLPEESTVFVEASGTVATLERQGDGSYQTAKVGGKQQEIPVGEYRVCVAPPEVPDLTPEEKAKYMSEGKPFPDPNAEAKAKFPIPEQYHSSGTTPLRVKVEKGSNQHDLDLKS